MEQHIDRTCVVVTALCNQPEAFASDVGDDQSCYLYGWFCCFRWRMMRVTDVSCVETSRAAAAAESAAAGIHWWAAGMPQSVQVHLI